MNRYELKIYCDDTNGGTWELPDEIIDAESMEAAENIAADRAIDELMDNGGLHAALVRIEVELLTDDERDTSNRTVEVTGTYDHPEVTVW